MFIIGKSSSIERPDFWPLRFANFIPSRQCVWKRGETVAPAVLRSSNWGEINDFGQIVGDSETAALDPNGEDICGFGTHLTCRPFLWEFPKMRALPTLGGNNGQASAINNRGQIVGFAENGALDSTCPVGTTNNRVALPVMWEKGTAKPLPLVTNDTDGDAFWINDQGQAVGYSGNCTTALHGVSWKTTLSPRFLTSEMALSHRALTTGAKLLGKSAALMAQPSLPRFGRMAQTAQSQTSALRREMLPPSPPASTTGAKWWEARWTPSSTGPMPSSGRTTC